MKVDYSYQDGDVRRIRRRLKSVAAVLYVLPTGGGKTHVAVRVILAELEAGGSVLFLAHRRELVQQAVARLIEGGFPEEDIGVIMSRDSRVRPEARVQVASVDTLRNREKPRATLLVLDEAHRSVATTWRKLIAMYPKAKRLGLTATPFRFDGKGLDDAFEEIIEGPSMVELFAFGALSPARIWSIDDKGLAERLRSVPLHSTAHGTDYARAALSKAMNRPRLVGRYVEHYQAHGGGHRAVVFAVDLEHAKAIARAFRRAGHAVEYLDASTSVSERAAILARLKSGETRVLVNCEILTEGWDCREAKVCILARPTRSCGLYMQMVGRFPRYWRGVHPVVLDHAGNVRRHGRPEEHRIITLDGGLEKGSGQAPVKACPDEHGGCGFVCPAGCRTCPECGYEFPERERTEEEEAELVELQRSEEERAGLLARLEAIAREKKLGPEFMLRARAEIGAMAR